MTEKSLNPIFSLRCKRGQDQDDGAFRFNHRFSAKGQKSQRSYPPDLPTATDLYRVIPRRRLELQGGERLVELPVLGLLPPPVLGQLALEKVSRGGGSPPTAVAVGYHLIGLLHGQLWLDIPLNLSNSPVFEI